MWLWCAKVESLFAHGCDSYRPNMTVVGLSLGFSGLLLGAIFIEWFVFDPFLEFFTLFFGVFIGFYSVRDIYDGTLLTVRHTGVSR